MSSYTSQQQETELAREMRVFDEEEAGVNQTVLAQALAAQAEEQARCARLRGEVASLSETTGNVAGVSSLSSADFLKAWKKIGSVKENEEWNRLEREVCNKSFNPLNFHFYFL